MSKNRTLFGTPLMLWLDFFRFENDFYTYTRLILGHYVGNVSIKQTKRGDQAKFRFREIWLLNYTIPSFLIQITPILVLKWQVGIPLWKWMKKIDLYFSVSGNLYFPLFFKKSVDTFEISDFIFPLFPKFQKCAKRIALKNLCGVEILNFDFFDPI